jgi:hypothetical protein
MSHDEGLNCHENEKAVLFTSILSLISICASSQMVEIGTSTPIARLEVMGENSVLVEAIKEQQYIIESQQLHLEAQALKLESFEKELQELKSLVLQMRSTQ